MQALQEEHSKDSRQGTRRGVPQGEEGKGTAEEGSS